MIDDIAFSGGCLRSWTHADAPELVQAWNDAEIARWNQVPPEPTLALAARWIEGQQDRFEKRLSVDLTIASEATGGVVGEVGLSGFSDQHCGALIGYWLLPHARGAGLASTAVATFTEWAHTALDLDVIVARCHENNVASQSVAARAGFVHEATDSTQHQLWRSHTRGP